MNGCVFVRGVGVGVGADLDKEFFGLWCVGFV